MNILFSLQNVSRSFLLNGKELPILKNISLDIEAGKWTTITGRSGSGKTTLLQIIGSLDRPNSGKVLYNGSDLAAMSDARTSAIRKNDFGFIFQSYHLLPELTALENVALPAMGWFRDRKAAAVEAADLLKLVNLEDRMHHRPQELSGGEQQRVAMARALINHPKVILADEPTGNLDQTSAKQVLDCLVQAKKQRNLTIVMVTHDMNIAAQADKNIDLNTL